MSRRSRRDLPRSAAAVSAGAALASSATATDATGPPAVVRSRRVRAAPRVIVPRVRASGTDPRATARDHTGAGVPVACAPPSEVAVRRADGDAVAAAVRFAPGAGPLGRGLRVVRVVVGRGDAVDAGTGVHAAGAPGRSRVHLVRIDGDGTRRWATTDAVPGVAGPPQALARLGPGRYRLAGRIGGDAWTATLA